MHRRIMPSKLSGVVWLVAVAATGGLTWFLHGDRSDFRGIAEDAKSIVSTASSVEVLDIRVQPGQIVHPGDTVVRLRSPDLSMRIAQVKRDIEGASGDANLNSAETQRRVAQLRAEFAARRAELTGNIRTLTDLNARNRSLVSGFKAMGVDAAGSDSSGLQEQIASIRNQLAVEESGVNSQIALLEGSKGSMGRLAASRNQALRNELAILQEEERRLSIVATIHGIVDSIHHRIGEKLSPFTPILTVSGQRPTLVRGYIHERIRTDLQVGDSVVVSAIGMRQAMVPGVVTALGARIVELPARLWKVPGIPLWGRETIVAIDPSNPLLLGEMVSVHRKGLTIGAKQ